MSYEDERAIIDGIVGPIFLRYPPREPMTVDETARAIVAQMGELEFKEEFQAIILRGDAKDSNSAAKAEALVGFHELGIYPPKHLLAWLADGFARWHNADGDISLEECLGLRKPESRRTANQLKALRRDRHIQYLIEEIHRLRYAFGLTIPDAAAMVADGTMQEGEPYDENYLRAHYKKSGISKDELFNSYMERLSDEARASILSRYPPHSYQHLIETCPQLRVFVEQMGG